MTAIVSRDSKGVLRSRTIGSSLWSSFRVGWGLARPILLLALPVVLAILTIGFVVSALRVESANHEIHALKKGYDVAVSTKDRPKLLLARIEYLLSHDRIDEVQPYVETLDRTGTIGERASAHYDFANGRLRQGFDEITASHLDKAGPYVQLARQEYRKALGLKPDMWDAKFNLDVASRLVRDFPAFERTMGDTVKSKKKLWTDVPGKPEGLP